MDEHQVYAQVQDDAALDTALYADDADVEFYTEDGAYRADVSDGWTTIRRVLLDRISDDAAAAEDVYDSLRRDGIEVSIRSPKDSQTLVEQESLGEYVALSGVRETIPQSVMEHEYVDGVCNYCGTDIDILQARPETDDLDVYIYDCDDCGNRGHYFGGEETEDGSVTIWTEFVSEDDLSRAVSLLEGSKITIFDLSATDADQPQGAEVYHAELGDDWETRPDGLLYRLLDRPVPLPDETRELLEDQMEHPNFGAAVFDPKGGSDIAHTDEDTYIKVIDTSQIHVND